MEVYGHLNVSISILVVQVSEITAVVMSHNMDSVQPWLFLSEFINAPRKLCMLFSNVKIRSS